ncbi:pantoate--beta-alanine ligase [Spirochaeta isovalerica]|uniref:Pantothenate synthetase n=1 Tax=Spirochaeta isovalerica TaxID=150 RepID=A0A841R9Z3_9SPIO|nr:pantoate--beta-alanine ligase [Spirochaeta isovalerica]MBB6479830.1 pantoate--beta-alanine ligase [Spirochaeta isovalerica]
MRIIRSIEEWRDIFRYHKRERRSVGLVPTMGALHDAHISLVKASMEENDLTAVSIFVNPTQFNNPDDLNNYPLTWDEDVRKLEEAGVDYLLYPSYEDMYRDGYKYKLIETDYSQDLCGTARPGHFDGVLSVVMKLINITKATRAYFGEKDWQQYRLIAGMAEAFFLDTEIIPCPIVREESGLAMSSRNKMLTPEELEIAPNFNRIITSGKSINEMKAELESLGMKVDYLKEKEGRIFGAVFLGKARLIDNVPL